MNKQDNNTGLNITSYHEFRNSAHLFDNNEQVRGSHTSINISLISTAYNSGSAVKVPKQPVQVS